MSQEVASVKVNVDFQKNTMPYLGKIKNLVKVSTDPNLYIVVSKLTVTWQSQALPEESLKRHGINHNVSFYSPFWPTPNRFPGFNNAKMEKVKS